MAPRSKSGTEMSSRPETPDGPAESSGSPLRNSKDGRTIDGSGQDWKEADRDQLETKTISAAVQQSAGLSSQIVNIVSMLKKELRTVLEELAQVKRELDDARQQLVDINKRRLDDLQQMPPNDSEAIRKWALSD